MVIDVFFSGLMLICLSGQRDCPVGTLGNTAWVVYADGSSKPCGWDKPEKTTLQLIFPTDQFFYKASPSLKCDDSDPAVTKCELASNPNPDLCIIPNSPVTVQTLDSSLQQVPRLAEIDRRFIALNTDEKHLNNKNWVPTHIHFPPGVISAGPKWWHNNAIPTQWSRSDGSRDGSLPRALSDRLKVTYQGASELTVTRCDDRDPVIKLKLKPFATRGEVTFGNNAAEPPNFYSSDKYDYLPYLLWYYRLGTWDSSDRECPVFSYYNDDYAVVLRCVRLKKKDALDKTDACARYEAAENVHWPPMLGGSY
jgi:hypothetical protein